MYWYIYLFDILLNTFALIQLVDIVEGYLTLMNDNGDLREDLKCPDGDIGNQIKTDFENGRELLVRNYFTLLKCKN